MTWTPTFELLKSDEVILQYAARYGQHATVKHDPKAGAVPISEAIAICRDKKGRGYVRWFSSLGTDEIDRCDFILLVPAEHGALARDGESHE